jgi:hypothetical protein
MVARGGQKEGGGAGWQILDTKGVEEGDDGECAGAAAGRREGRHTLDEHAVPPAATKPKRVTTGKGRDAVRLLAAVKAALDSGDVVFGRIVDWRALMGPVLGVHFDLDLQGRGPAEGREGTGEEAGSRPLEEVAVKWKRPNASTFEIVRTSKRKISTGCR